MLKPIKMPEWFYDEHNSYNESYRDDDTIFCARVDDQGVSPLELLDTVLDSGKQLPSHLDGRIMRLNYKTTNGNQWPVYLERQSRMVLKLNRTTSTGRDQDQADLVYEYKEVDKDIKVTTRTQDVASVKISKLKEAEFFDLYGKSGENSMLMLDLFKFFLQNIKLKRVVCS